MPQDQTLPNLWLLSDARNDAALEDALRALPTGSGFIFRHYHLSHAERMERFLGLKLIARICEHRVILAGSAVLAEEWGADGVYGSADRLGPLGKLMRLATAHDADEIQAANAADVDAILLSPVFPTRSHPDASVLGPFGFNVLAQQADAPVIALGGMTKERAEMINWPRWAAIDGLT